MAKKGQKGDAWVGLGITAKAMQLKAKNPGLSDEKATAQAFKQLTQERLRREAMSKFGNAAATAGKVAVKSSVRGNALTGVVADMVAPSSTSKKADAPKNQGRARAANQIEVKAKRGKGR